MAIALTLKDMVTGGIGNIIDEFKRLEGVTDEVKGKLNDLKNVGITGGALFGAGAFGLDKTLDVLSEVTNEAASFEDSMTVLMNKSFGKNLIDPTYKKQVDEVKDYFSDWGMEIGASTTFDSSEILDSFTELSKGGIGLDEIYDTGKANAFFAQVNRVAATATAEGTVQMKEGFRLVGEEVLHGMELINQYADATIADSLALQRALGNVAGTASTIWGSRNRMEITRDTIALTAITTNVLGDESRSATDVKNFLNRANMTVDTMSKPQREAMTAAGWLDSEGHSIFIDYENGMLKDAAELQRILKETEQKLSDVELGNLLKTVFREQGAPVAAALAKGIDLGELEINASSALSIADQVELEMGRFNAVKDTFEENISNFKKVVGAPFLDTGKNIFRGLSEQIENVTEYFKQHPEVTKFIFALAGGLSVFLMVIGTIMGIIAAVGSLKLAFNLAAPHILGAIKPVLGVMIPVMLAVLALAGVAYILYRNWDKVGPHFQSIFEKIQTILSIGRQDFDKFVAFIAPLIGRLISFIERGVLWISMRVLPLIDKGLGVIIRILQGDFKGAWESLSPIARTVLTVFSPVLIGLAAMLAFATAKTLVLAAAFVIKTAVMQAASIAMAIWKGVMIAVSVVQTVWNVAMGIGTAQTLLQKAAVIGFLPVIAAIKVAKLAWTGIQWALNAAMAANPIGLVIIAIGALIAVVVLVVTHFKEICEWVGKAWDKLKGFLGFKSESKEALEEPIDMTVTTEENKVENVSIVPEFQSVNQSDMLVGLGLENGSFKMPVTADIAGMGDFDINEMYKSMGLSDGMIDVPVSADISDLGSFDLDAMYAQMGLDGGLLPIETSIDTGLFSEQMEGFSTDLSVSGTEAGQAFASGFNDPQVIAATKQATEAINNAIIENLITQSDMHTWGTNLMQSFIDGMKSKFAVLEQTVKDVSALVGDYMKVNSPTKKGDLNTNNLWGGNLIRSFADGMIQSSYLLQGASALASSNIAINGMAALNFKQYDIPAMKFRPVDEPEMRIKSGGQTGKGENNAPVHIHVYPAPNHDEAKIADNVIKKLEKKNRGKAQTSKSSLVMSPNGYKGGY